MINYNILVAEMAHKRGYTAIEMMAKDYFGVAEMCGVIIKKNGDSPIDYDYEAIRSSVATTLREEEEAAKLATLVIAVGSAIALLNKSVVIEDGKMVVK